MNELKKYNEVTPDDIRDWKAKYGEDNISQIIIKTADDKTADFIVRKPSRPVVDAVAKHNAAKDTTAAAKSMINNCILAGDIEKMEQDGGIYSSLLVRLTEQIKSYDTEVKKL